jgi:hypothetical protein
MGAGGFCPLAKSGGRAGEISAKGTGAGCPPHRQQLGRRRRRRGPSQCHASLGGSAALSYRNVAGEQVKSGGSDRSEYGAEKNRKDWKKIFLRSRSSEVSQIRRIWVSSQSKAKRAAETEEENFLEGVEIFWSGHHLTSEGSGEERNETSEADNGPCHEPGISPYLCCYRLPPPTPATPPLPLAAGSSQPPTLAAFQQPSFATLGERCRMR